jgi:hypothetical protein
VLAHEPVRQLAVLLSLRVLTVKGAIASRRRIASSTVPSVHPVCGDELRALRRLALI